MSEWREDVKKVLLKAGLQNLPITFLFSDTQVQSHSSGQGSGWAEQRVLKWYPLSGQSYILNFLYTSGPGGIMIGLVREEPT